MMWKRVQNIGERLQRWVDSGLPVGDLPPVQRRRQRMLNTLLAMLVLTLPIHIASRLALGMYVSAAGSALCWVCLGLALVWLRSGAPLDRVAQAVLAVGVVTSVALTASSGSPQWPGLSFVAGIPLLAIALLDAGPAALWTMVCVVTAVAFPLLVPTVPNLVTAGRGADVATSISYTFLVVYITGIGLFQRKLAEDASAEYRDAARRADAANAAKSTFLANMSHELRTPMHGIQGLVQVLISEARDPESLASLRTVYDSSRRLVSMLDDLLDLSKIESGKLVIESVPFRPARIADGVIKLLAESAERKRIRLVLECGPGVESDWLGDPLRLKQVLTNLVSNAIKFTERGSVVVRARVAAQRLRFEVEDTGVGIAPESRDRVFEPFVQADDSTTRRFGGTGLGLTICRGLVRDMRGHIDFASDPGRGSRFWFEVPVEPSATHSQTTHDSSITTGHVDGGHVLVAEDDATSQLVARRMLEHLGYEVDVVSSGEEAIEQLEKHPWRYQVVLMDWHMPGLDGLAATRKMRERGLRLPVIALTASTRLDDQRAAMDAGMDDFVGKPFRMDVLAECLQRNLSRPGTPGDDPRKASVVA
jgi:signal transduction histidine kinase/CheY-like chemotaxis protein